MTIALWTTVLLLAFANGSNDNSKGVATLRGSGLAGYTVTILWGTGWTFVGALLSAKLAARLMTLFNGQGLLPPDAGGRPELSLTVALAAAATVLLASRIGAPISTTHTLTGAWVGGGIVAVGMGNIHFETLGRKFLLPLLASPFLSLGLTLLLFPLVAPLRRFANACVCLVRREPALISREALIQSSTVQSMDLVVGTSSECETIGVAGRFAPLSVVHWLSAGLMSLSRGLNDTPKIAALLMAAPPGVGTGAPMMAVFAAASAMALGGMVGARRVSQTLSEKITPMDPVQGLSANVITLLLVSGASQLGLPVSTTHVACGSLFGIGVLRKGETDWRQVLQILLAWGITLPVAALLGASFYFLFKVLP